jgi:hypothetical protein
MGDPEGVGYDRTSGEARKPRHEGRDEG